jgi:Putative beta barrel porin-7 (BBP7)
MLRFSHWLGVVLAVVVTTSLRAQPELPASAPRPELLPPVPPAELCGPVKPEPPAVIEALVTDQPPSAAPTPKCDQYEFYLGTDSMEYLLWWMKSGPLPPLATRNRAGSPALSSADTRVIAGGDPANLDAFSGGRFTLGSRFGYANVGTEYGYFFLGTRTTSLVDAGGVGAVGRPIINAVTGAESNLPAIGPAVRDGVLAATASARAQGVEANVVVDLFHDDHGGLTGLVGYRFLQIQEGIFVGQSGALVTPSSLVPFTIGDQFDTSNRFHGGQIGLRADGRKGPVFAEVAGKIAFGQTTEVIRIYGQTGLPPTVVLPGGLLALPSNSGRQVREAFAVVPEASLKLGFEYEGHRAFVGYDFTYLSDAVRPGDQIDRTVNVGQVPLIGGSPAFAGPERPRLTAKASDFWLQGLMFGLETRW